MGRDRRKKLIEGRKELVSDYAVEPFLTSLAFLVRMKRTKTIRSRAGSYSLKHIAERLVCTYPEGNKLGPHYVPNGVLIAAAIQAGFQYRPYADEFGDHNLNVGFNMAKQPIDEADREIRPEFHSS